MRTVAVAAVVSIVVHALVLWAVVRPFEAPPVSYRTAYRLEPVLLPEPYPEDPPPTPEECEPLEECDAEWERRCDYPPDGGAEDHESYAPISESRLTHTESAPLSTFAMDVDTASWSNVRRILREGRLPPRDAVRAEEFLNYFRYADRGPEPGRPFGVTIEVAGCPWDASRRLARVGIQARSPADASRKPANLVFLIDVSGSMDSPGKLPLVKASLRLLAGTLQADDRVSIVVYAGAAGLVLPATPGADRAAIDDAIERLDAGGSTAGSEGIRLAYETARAAFVPGGINRVVLATDGDFNVGVTSPGTLVELIRGEAAGGVFLTVLGFGTGNLEDATMELLADRGNGHCAYIDSLAEARRVLVDEVRGTLDVVAKDAKVQVEFNAARVAAWRLIGYENRLLAREDFDDDRVDGGEVGAGHRVTALYELVPAGDATGLPAPTPLRYGRANPAQTASDSEELLTVKIRWKEPDGDASALAEFPARDGGARFDEASADLRFAASVAEFASLLRSTEPVPAESWSRVRSQAASALGDDPGGWRREFTELVATAAGLAAVR